MSANLKSLADGWTSFERAVVGPLAGGEQRRDMRIAFYAGAAVAFTLLERAFTLFERDDGEITDEDMQFVTRLNDELEAFAREMTPGARSS